MKRWLLFAAFVLIIGLPATAYNTGPLPAVPVVMGHTVDEIDGLKEFIESLIPPDTGGGGIRCDPTPLYNSVDRPGGVVFRYYNHIYGDGNRTIPASCFSAAGCIIQQEIYSSKGLLRTRQFEYNQEANNKWFSAYRTSGRYTNGDSGETTVISTVGYQYMKDDYKYGTATDERDPKKWTFIDVSKSYGQKVFICDVGEEVEEEPA